VLKKEYQSRAWMDVEEYCSGEKGTRPVLGVRWVWFTRCPKCWDV